LEKTVEERTGELKARSLELEQANRAKSDFLATMSHEIRTPLNAVIGLSDIEMRTLPQSETRDSFAQIHQSGTYLLGIINDILDISKIESGNIELNPAEYDTAQMISEVVNLNKVRLGNKPIDFTVDIDGDFPARLVGDELRIKQVLNNLLSNAGKFTDSGEINLRIFLTQRAQSTQRNTLDSEDPNIHLCDLSGLCGENSLRICFEVRDTGIGIRAEDVDKLFRDYSQLDTGANRKYEGTGLGLAITKRLVEMMGGTITVESEYGKGSTFTAQIVQQFTEEKEEMNNIIHELPIPSAHSVKPCASVRDNIKILAVDDVAGNLLLIRKMLAPYGVVVNTADNGKEAVGMIEAGKYDLIFMDHMMPGMDGIETLQKINRTYSSEKSHLRSGENRNERLPPIIMLTATAMTGMKEYYLEQGFDDYLSKPINAKELDELLKRWLGVGSGGEEAGQLTYSQDYLSEHRRLAIEITERKKWDLKADSEVMGIEHEQVKPLLHRFKEEVVMGNLDEAEKILFEIGSFNLDQPARKFYYTLHNCILTMDIKKIMELL
jgi:signal transduction histidine kinase/CheY-like chemotaxis protein